MKKALNGTTLVVLASLLLCGLSLTQTGKSVAEEYSACSAQAASTWFPCVCKYEGPPIFSDVSNAPGAGNITELISVAWDGTPGNDNSHDPSISGDGRYVAFVSSASNLVPNDANETPDVFIRDRCTHTTIRVPGSGDCCGRPSISDDGRYVAFEAFTDDGCDVFVYDRQTNSTIPIDFGNGPSDHPSISGNGRYIAFRSDSANILVYNQQTHATTTVSFGSGGSQYCSISDDGRYVAFDYWPDGVVQELYPDIFVYSRGGTATRVSLTYDGDLGNEGSLFPSISGDGSCVAFYSWADNLVPKDNNECCDIYLRDRRMETTVRVSVGFYDTQANDESCFDIPSMSDNGHYVAFSSMANNLVSNDANSSEDVFVRDRQTNTTTRVSVASDGTEGNFSSGQPSISDDGHCVAFTSVAGNLVPNDTNGYADVFVNAPLNSIPWSFAVITDLHVGREFKGKDYNGPGWNDSGAGQENIASVKFLRQAVGLINLNKDKYNIKFVAVLGDISESAELSQFNKAIEILNDLDIPWVPLIGNHDVWPFSTDVDRAPEVEQPGYKGTDWYFDDKFNSQYETLANEFQNWKHKKTEVPWPVPNPNTDPPHNSYFQNFAFDCNGYHFICLDFNYRDNAAFGLPGVRPEGDLHNFSGGTWDWFTNHLQQYVAAHPDSNKNIILFAHHPFNTGRVGFDAFNPVRLLEMDNFLKNYKTNIYGEFAGHCHRIFNSWLLLSNLEAIETDANMEKTLIRIVQVSPGGNIDYSRFLPEKGMAIKALCPIDLVVTDPDNLTISKDSNQISGATYTEIHLDGDENLDDLIEIPERKVGEYSIEVIPEPGANPTDTYTIEVSTLEDSFGWVSMAVADNVTIAATPTEPYVFRSTERKPAQLTYAGDLNGASSASVSLQAVLVDENGAPLSERTITFEIGDQSASAVTDTNGLASTTLVLNQAAGEYYFVNAYFNGDEDYLPAYEYQPFTVTVNPQPAPTVTSTSPTKGTTADSALSATISGTGFQTGAIVELNDNGDNAVAGTNVNVVGPNTIMATFNLSGVTTNLGGKWDVKVTNPDSQTGTGDDLFTIYRPNPIATSIIPSTGVNTGTVNITSLVGANFVSGQTSVKLTRPGQPDINCTNVAVASDTQLTCTFDLTGAATGTWDAVVTVNGAETPTTLSSGFTVTAATECAVTFNFVDQNGHLTGTGEERVYVDGLGWKADGDQITVTPDTTISYQAYYKQGSGLYGPKVTQKVTGDMTIDVMFYTLNMDFENQDGDLNPAGGIGTGDERVYIDNVGYKADGDKATVPLNSTVAYTAYFKQGSGLYGPKSTAKVDSSFADLQVSFYTLTMDFENQDGDLNPAGGIGTGEERVYIDNVGYKADGDKATVPLNGTVAYTAYFKQGSGLYGPKSTAKVDGSFADLQVSFYTLTMDFENQDGDLNPAGGIGTGDERVYIDNVGYKADGDKATVPLNGTVAYTAYFKQGSGLYGPKGTSKVDGTSADLKVIFRSLSFEVIDSATKAPVDNAQVYIDNVGYISNGGMAVIPVSGTIQHKAKVGSTWSVVSSKLIDTSWSNCTYEWDGATFSNPSYD